MTPAALTRAVPLPLSDRISLTKREAAQSVGVSTRFLELEAAAGRLKVIRAGRKVLIRPADLTAWLESRGA